ncbi:MAG: hypothetical protein ABIL58_21490 [Pseudomonadota bacterium]
MTDNAIAAEPLKSKCIVMPLRPEAGQSFSGVGMGLHFMLGNIIVLHSGFEEMWFGWRYKKVFPDVGVFSDYVHRPDAPLDIVATGKTQKVRYWIEGWYRITGDVVSTRLIFTDAETGRRIGDDRLTADPTDQYIGYRVDVMNWMASCGLAFPDVQAARVLWSEELPLPALEVFGRGLEAYYIHTGFGGIGPVDLSLLDRAVAQAPHAYLPQDMRGWVLYKNQDYPAAAAAFRAAVDINPHGAGAMAGLMWLGVVAGNAREAYAWAEAKAEACGTSIQDAREKTTRLLKKQAGK